MTPSRRERRATGKARRNKCSRVAHGTWKPHAKRHDPIDLLIESSTGRMQQLVPIRYGRIMQSPFAVYRCAAAILAADLAHTPVSRVGVEAAGLCLLRHCCGCATPLCRITFEP